MIQTTRGVGHRLLEQQVSPPGKGFVVVRREVTRGHRGHGSADTARVQGHRRGRRRTITPTGGEGGRRGTDGRLERGVGNWSETDDRRRHRRRYRRGRRRIAVDIAGHVACTLRSEVVTNAWIVVAGTRVKVVAGTQESSGGDTGK